ncbi:MAG: ribose 5-phosphate isomerase B [Ruminococcaceae bacterium]|nr:ribose 5-phosphate isomerase B [Oscillospiraceae bacterium]
MIVIGSDHGGYELKEVMIKYLKSIGKEVKDCGTFDGASVDYPDIAKEVCAEYKKGGYEFGILICGTGIGISIAANKIEGIRCALLNNEYSAKMTKRHNNSNIIAFGGRVVGPDMAIGMLEAYMTAEFEGGRHQKRIDKVSELEK